MRLYNLYLYPSLTLWLLSGTFSDRQVLLEVNDIDEFFSVGLEFEVKNRPLNPGLHARVHVCACMRV